MRNPEHAGKCGGGLLVTERPLQCAPAGASFIMAAELRVTCGVVGAGHQLTLVFTDSTAGEQERGDPEDHVRKGASGQGDRQPGAVLEAAAGDTVAEEREECIFAVTIQNSAVINCYLMTNYEEKEDTETELEVFRSLYHNTDLNCFQISNYTYKAASTVEVNIFELVRLKIEHNINETISCSWLLEQKNRSHIIKASKCSTVLSLDLGRVSEKQAGTYKLLIQCKNINYTIDFEVIVGGKPRKPYFTAEGKVVRCISEGFPAPDVRWEFDTPCHHRCEDKGSLSLLKTDSYRIMRVQHEVEAKCLMGHNDTCCASNKYGTECAQLPTIDLTLGESQSEIFVKSGDPLVIRCWANYQSFMYKISGSESQAQMQWNEENCYNNKNEMIKVLFASTAKMKGGSNTSINCLSNVHGNKTVLLTLFDKGIIDMNITSEEQDVDSREEHCFIAEFKAFPPGRCAWFHQSKPSKCAVITEENGRSTSKYCSHTYEPGDSVVFFIDNDDVQLKKTFTVNLLQKPKVECKISKMEHITCQSWGYPLSNWKWLRSYNDSHNCTEVITEGITYGSPYRSAKAWESTSSLILHSDRGSFIICSCANNSVGLTCTQTLVNQQEKNNFVFSIATGTCGLCLSIVAIVFIVVLCKYKKQYKYESQLLMIQYVGPSDNEYIYIDFSVLEYDLKWEFPRENLEIGKTIGSGAFGKVVTATAYGISKPGVSLQVAVKMLKENPDASEKEALMSELKMMIQIGHHENVVNLLGACTTSGPVYLIFEYCPYGDLLNHLKSKRETFHKTWSDVIKGNNFTFYHNFNQEEKFRDRVVTSVSNCSYSRLHSAQECDKNQHSWDMSSGHTELHQGEEIKYQNTRKYEDEDLNILTLEDLLSFSYQVAKGMEFLESKMCIHRDLAARNVLITGGKMAKICDFGLARDVENDSNYVVKGNARLPVKWMSPESIFHGIYTIKSDVWSYGIMLWEIFSLGVNPYPGMPVNANFYKLLQSGFKMDQPYYATDEIYFLMQSCWASDPRKRPSFIELVSFLGYQISNTESVLYQNTKNISGTVNVTVSEKNVDCQSALTPLI
ncbi:PREDICTED: receptor-type tyrosine-protein kinase FLT3 [Nanorana parkeri]|uniref:receptor-type tyrosine-protein kinase FLT3 n=1 Tax=Nanorana parkeri TaxID=125878 RepID=UPI0008546ADA|nr:PREDICTED: receptor-type tyrosine-protein kinase FLT3 [Nanorana parkeri]